MSGSYYNENDRNAAAWLRELINNKLIADGEVDERSIEEVKAQDLNGFTQCHFFAGIGVWSYALRKAGWPDDSPVWTGSCPCQGFSASGKRGGFSDKRHLWPVWFRLIEERQPRVIFGEQVASKDGLAWLDVVSADLEGKNYAFGSADLCSAGFGAPHIRQRLYFVADASSGFTGDRGIQCSGKYGQRKENGSSCQLADPSQLRGCRERGNATCPRCGGYVDSNSGSELMGNSKLERLEGHAGNERDRNQPGRFRENAARPVTPPGFTNGYWRDSEWLYCRDEKFRPVEPGSFPLVNGAPARMGRLRGYGNAIVAPVAQAFIESYMEVAG